MNIYKAYVFSYSKETLQVRIKASSTLFFMSGCRDPWSNTNPLISLRRKTQTDQRHLRTSPDAKAT